MLAAVVAVFALAGMIVAVVVSSRGGDSGTNAAPTRPATTSPTTPAPSLQATTSAAAATATTAQTRTAVDTSATRPVRPVKLPPPPSPTAPKRREFTVGTVDDSLAQQGLQFTQSQVDLSHGAGFDSHDSMMTRMAQRR